MKIDLDSISQARKVYGDAMNRYSDYAETSQHDLAECDKIHAQAYTVIFEAKVCEILSKEHRSVVAKKKAMESEIDKLTKVAKALKHKHMRELVHPALMAEATSVILDA